MSIQDFLIGTVSTLFAGWNGYNTHQIDKLQDDQADHEAAIVALKTKLDSTYDLLKEVREDQKQRRRDERI